MSKRKVANLVMDAVVSVTAVESEIAHIVADIDQAIKEDLANDPMLTAGLDLLRDGLSRIPPNSEAYKDIYAAKAKFQKATEMDFSDQSKERAKRRIIPMLEKVADAVIALRELSGAIQEGAE